MPSVAEGNLLAGRYRLLRRLGAGGAAVVFLAEDERLGRKVAVKRLHAHHAAGMAERFAREARLGAGLNHPNLVSTFDTEPDDESVLIVMEYVDGRTLADALRPGPPRAPESARILGAVGAALDHAHSHGVVHRDVKPANVLLRADGVVKLADLGIATAAEQTRITSSGIVLGTASYMAPEQLEGHEAGSAADVYALACVAFEMLSGKKARPGRNPMEVAHRLASEPVPDLAEAWPEAPPAAVEILRRGMAIDPDDRPPAAGRLAADLERTINRSSPAQAPLEPTAERVAAPRRPRVPYGPVTGPERRQRSRRGRLPAAALAVLALAVTAIAAVALLGSSGGGSDRKPGDHAASPSPTRKGSTASKAGGSGAAGGAGTDSGARSSSTGSGSAPPSTTPGADGATNPTELNRQGFALSNEGRYDQAIPLLQRAVRSFPTSSTDTTYAYALFNLGHALRLAGRADEAVPILERRLRIPNQTATVRRELDAARAHSGR